MKWLKSLNVFLLGSSLLVSLSLPVSAQNNNHIKMTDQFTLNPGEPGIHLPVRATIHHLNNGATQVFDANNVLLLTTSDANASLLPTPGGLTKANHVYGVPDATVIDHVGNIVKFKKDGRVFLTVIDDNPYIQKARPPSTITWNEYAYNWTGLDTFVAYWTCPSSPASSSTNITNYLFNGIQPPDNSEIIQPVLAWNGLDGPAGWGGAAWYFYSSGSTHTSYTTVSVGNSLEGYLHNIGGYNWDIYFYNLSTSSSRSLTAYNTNISTSPQGGNFIAIALESYNGTADGDLYNADIPGKTRFTNIGALLNGSGVSPSWNNTIVDHPWFHMPDRDVTWSGYSSVNLTTGN